uniref:Uncharacterized protein n=1 Tax=Triticum urartu TaxID=4572 RepID=A0A8R7UQY6_TRIUA
SVTVPCRRRVTAALHFLVFHPPPAYRRGPVNTTKFSPYTAPCSFAQMDWVQGGDSMAPALAAPGTSPADGCRSWTGRIWNTPARRASACFYSPSTRASASSLFPKELLHLHPMTGAGRIQK